MVLKNAESLWERGIAHKGGIAHRGGSLENFGDDIRFCSGLRNLLPDSLRCKKWQAKSVATNQAVSMPCLPHQDGQILPEPPSQSQPLLLRSRCQVFDYSSMKVTEPVKEWVPALHVGKATEEGHKTWTVLPFVICSCRLSKAWPLPFLLLAFPSWGLQYF